MDPSEFSTAIEHYFRDAQVMAIFRNMPTALALKSAEAAWDAGIDVVEIPVQTRESVQALAAVVAAGSERGKVVAAGTVVEPGQVDASRDAGASFTVAPGLSDRVIDHSARVGLPHIPGVATATEVEHAMRRGMTWLKAFPATALGTAWFRAMLGPFPGAVFVATGGIDADNAGAFIDAGAQVVAVGSAINRDGQISRLATIARRGAVR